MTFHCILRIKNSHRFNFSIEIFHSFSMLKTHLKILELNIAIFKNRTCKISLKIYKKNLPHPTMLKSMTGASELKIWTVILE